MNVELKSFQKEIVNNRKRVRDYGEVFTPKRVVKDILDMPAICEAIQDIGTTFLEPAVGEGVFLVEILLRKLRTVAKEQTSSLIGFENHSLYALSTLYGIELLEDNAQRCVINLYEAYYRVYQKQAKEHGKDMKPNVLDSAKLIISKNIVQGDFLRRLSVSGRPLIFSEWKITNFRKGIRSLVVQRTEYTLDEILLKATRESDKGQDSLVEEEQLSLFRVEEIVEPQLMQRKYKPVRITDVFREEEESNESSGNQTL